MNDGERSMKNKFAWCITGSGDEIDQLLNSMMSFKESHQDIDIRVFLSKSAEQVLTWYKLNDKIRSRFKVKTETSPNTPFLAGEVQSGKYDFMIVAPTTSNSTSKCSFATSSKRRLRPNFASRPASDK